MISNKFGLNLETVFSYKPFFDEKCKNFKNSTLYGSRAAYYQKMQKNVLRITF